MDICKYVVEKSSDKVVSSNVKIRRRKKLLGKLRVKGALLKCVSSMHFFCWTYANSDDIQMVFLLCVSSSAVSYFPPSWFDSYNQCNR